MADSLPDKYVTLPGGLTVRRGSEEEKRFEKLPAAELKPGEAEFISPREQTKEGALSDVLSQIVGGFTKLNELDPEGSKHLAAKVAGDLNKRIAALKPLSEKEEAATIKAASGADVLAKPLEEKGEK